MIQPILKCKVYDSSIGKFIEPGKFNIVVGGDEFLQALNMDGGKCILMPWSGVLDRVDEEVYSGDILTDGGCMFMVLFVHGKWHLKTPTDFAFPVDVEIFTKLRRVGSMFDKSVEEIYTEVCCVGA